jgi:hypothetical protein
MEVFNCKKLNGVAIKEQSQLKISNRFVALKNFDDDDDDDDLGISRAWETEYECFSHRQSR